MEFNERQLQAINAKDGLYAVIAAAGSGKTAVLVERTKRLVESGINPKKILIISFSNEAKENLIKRLKGYDVCIKTFHGLAYGIVRMFNKDVQLWEQSWEKERVIADTVNKFGYRTEDVDYFGVYKYISYQKFNLKTPENAIETDEMPYELEQMKKIYSDYEKHKKEKNLIEFDDMVMMAINYLKTDSATLEKLQNLIEYCMVDEFQDTSTDQIAFLKMLTKKNKNLMAVGDPRQNIYSFRGANAKYITYFDKYFPGGIYINMNTNYRSSQEIVGFSNIIAKDDSSSKTDNYEDSITPNNVGVSPTILETKEICKHIKTYLEKGYDYKDMFILTRTNAELQDFEASLSVEGIPYRTYNNKSFLDSPEIKVLTSYLLLSDNLKDNDSFIYVMNRPSRFLAKATLNKIKDDSLYNGLMKLAKEEWKLKRAANDLSFVIGSLRTNHFDNVGSMIHFIRHTLDLDNFIRKDQVDTDDRIENMDKFEKTCEGFTSVEQLKVFMNKIQTNNKKKDENKVHLLTAHKSKGMQNKVVFVAGMNEEKFPHKNATDIESEVRLFYVACTRAEEHLILLKDFLQPPSMFLKYYNDYIQKNISERESDSA